MAALGLCVCFIVFTVLGVLGGGTVTIKGLYCKDPDDNTFHPVNSTWRSSTFCGNYTCKIRKKNDTLPLEKSAPSINPIDQIDDQENAGSEFYTVKEKKSELSQYENETNENNHEGKNKQSINDTYDEDVNASKRDEVIRRFEDNIIAHLGEKGDRYLNTAEINAITNLLHTVKKSDLEAILEVYTLAKDIFNEIDENTMERFAERENSKFTPTRTGVGKLTYFYDPYTMANVHNKHQKDLKGETSNTVNSVIPTQMYNEPFLRSRNEKSLDHYPVSNFHRTSSYYHPYAPTQAISTAPTNTAQKPEVTANGSCCSPISANPFAAYATERRTKPQFMPYPFTYIMKNNAYPYDPNPWSQPYMNPIAYSQQTQQVAPSYLYRPPQATPDKTIDYHTDILEEIYGAPHQSKLIEKLVPTVEANKPAWQTAQLSPEVIDDVRANILQKTEKILNIIPRKKIKLERVAKVLKIDELARSKREIGDESNVEEKEFKETESVLEEYEAYIVKETCGPTIEPGYFRVGNMSQPFPKCCPQKIEKTIKTV